MSTNYIETYSNVLIVEPNDSLTVPYKYVSSSFQQIRVKSTKSALKELSHRVPDIAFLSSSLSTRNALVFLEALKNCSQESLIPLIIVIDISNRINFVPGTSWGGKLAIVDSICTKLEFNTIFKRILRSK